MLEAKANWIARKKNLETGARRISTFRAGLSTE
jgi:hypothetical protein